MIKMHLKTYKCCGVPVCRNTSISTPNKLFVYVPSHRKIRDEWFKLAHRDPNSVQLTSHVYFCEDHFDLPNDMENYMEYHIRGFVSRVRMKPGCKPTKFKCQQNRIEMLTYEPTEQPVAVKRRMLDSCERLNKNSMVTDQTDCEDSSDSSDSNTSNVADNSESDPLAQAPAQCRFCGDSTNHFVDTDYDLSYITDNKTCLSINCINIEIDFNDPAPKNICVHCDKKLKEILDFVKLVRLAQDNLSDIATENTELLIVKTEFDLNYDDTIEAEIDTSKKSELGELSTRKRKSNETTKPKQKKAKSDELENEHIDLLIDIKQENIDEEYTETPETFTHMIVKSECDIDDATMETDNAKDANEQNGVNTTSLRLRDATTEPADAASELEKARCNLLNALGYSK